MKTERNGISEAEAAEQSRKYAGKVSEETVGEMVGKEGKLKGFFRHISVLQKYWKDVCEVFSLLKDWMAGRYPVIPWTVIATLVGALLYVLSPLDLIPDFIPVVGFTDDAGVFAVALSFAGSDLEKYREWKRQRAETIDAEWDEEDA
ncbi:MAG: DUF1232 domain-containing protein [Kiritimatiellae bacterium]|nr:DUF1232 domain-containing protein [Bacteroidales bacterium]MBR3582918.1 DUF1232 domain-containing protein [Kiritimatiellia bacterium]